MMKTKCSLFLLAAMLPLCLLLFGCGAQSASLEATVVEITGNTMLVAPAKDAPERKSSDRFVISISQDDAFAVGDLVEIFYDGQILETDPARLGNVEQIRKIDANLQDKTT